MNIRIHAHLQERASHPLCRNFKLDPEKNIGRVSGYEEGVDDSMGMLLQLAKDGLLSPDVHKDVCDMFGELTLLRHGLLEDMNIRMKADGGLQVGSRNFSAEQFKVWERSFEEFLPLEVRCNTKNVQLLRYGLVDTANGVAVKPHDQQDLNVLRGEAVLPRIGIFRGGRYWTQMELYFENSLNGSGGGGNNECGPSQNASGGARGGGNNERESSYDYSDNEDDSAFIGEYNDIEIEEGEGHGSDGQGEGNVIDLS